MTTPLHVLSAGAAKGLVEALRWDFEKASSLPVEAHFGAVGAIKEELLQGAPCDVLILTQRVLEDLVRDSLVDAASIRPLGHVSTGIAVLAGEPHPAIHDADALVRTLRAASAIYLPDPKRATAGIHLMRVIEKLGLAADVDARLQAYPNGAAAMGALARSSDARAVGCTQVTEILYTPGVELAGRLPPGLDLSTLYGACVCRRATSPDVAQRLVDMLAGEAVASMRRQGGFEPA
ncbi:MAG: substrate-binding domain-containing protein [Pseudomonadota bacterium]|nr:substrate-binding domain-containing protein [Pseudomonadota bacterium]